VTTTGEFWSRGGPLEGRPEGSECPGTVARPPGRWGQGRAGTAEMGRNVFWKGWVGWVYMVPRAFSINYNRLFHF
jgi:hypothetical protein